MTLRNMTPIISGLALLGVVGAADAADLEPFAPVPAAWSFRATTYGWLTWLDGDATIRGRNFAVDASVSDVISALDFAIMGTVEARKGPLSLWTDLVYADLSGSDDILRSRPNANLGAAVSSSIRMTTIEVAAALEVARHQSFLFRWPGYLRTDLYAGGRYWNQRAAVALDLTGTVNIDGLEVSGSRAIARSGTVDWVDPIIGVRVRHDLPGGGEAFVRGDIGGFGAGSDLSWQVFGAVNWHLAQHYGIAWDTYLGYRALSVDYEQGTGNTRYRLDVTEHGPVIGLTGRF